MSNMEEDDEKFGAEVYDYSVVGDPGWYANHIFGLQIWFLQDTYSIQRSYSSFCLLDMKLRKKYPSTNIPILKLSGLSLFSGKGNLPPANDIDKVAADLYASMMGNSPVASRPDKGVKRTDTNEVISQKKAFLGIWLCELLKIPEVLMSDDFVDFLNVNSIDGFPISDAEITPADILLSGKTPLTKTVSKSFSVSIDAKANNFVTWRFSTKNKDIGFSVEFCTPSNKALGLSPVVLVPYQRFDCHLQQVTGSVEVPSVGDCILNWDNSYALLRSKQLSYVTSLEESTVMETASILATETGKCRAIHVQQKVNLKKILSNQSQTILSRNMEMYVYDALGVSEERIELAPDEISPFDKPEVAESTVTTASPKPEEVRLFSLPDPTQPETDIATAHLNVLLEKQVAYLKCENQSLVEAMSALEADLSKERATVADNAEIIAKVTVIEAELEAVKMELDVKNRKDDIVLLDNADKLSDLKSTLSQVTDTLAMAEKSNATLEENAARLKAEKKQLKSYALQVKQDLENVQRDASVSRHEYDLLVRELSSVKHELVKSKEESEAMEEKFKIQSQQYQLLVAAASAGQPMETTPIPIPPSSHVDNSFLFPQDDGVKAKAVNDKPIQNKLPETASKSSLWGEDSTASSGDIWGNDVVLNASLAKIAANSKKTRPVDSKAISSAAIVMASDPGGKRSQKVLLQLDEDELSYQETADNVSISNSGNTSATEHDNRLELLAASAQLKEVGVNHGSVMNSADYASQLNQSNYHHSQPIYQNPDVLRLLAEEDDVDVSFDEMKEVIIDEMREGMRDIKDKAFSFMDSLLGNDAESGHEPQEHYTEMDGVSAPGNYSFNNNTYV